jgi:hypothetical protein
LLERNEAMRQAIMGVSIFLGLQAVFVLVLFGMTLWEGRQLDRSVPEPAERRADR